MPLSSKFLKILLVKNWENWSIFSEDNYGESTIAYFFWSTLYSHKFGITIYAIINKKMDSSNISNKLTAENKNRR